MMDGYKLYHMDDSGRKVDLSDKQKELADQAKDRSAENPKAKCCGYLYHATVKDRKVKDNIPPFRCNCDREPHNEKEWAKLDAAESWYEYFAE